MSSQITRAEYIEDCREVAKNHFDNKQMLVSYVRAKRTKPLYEGVNAQQVQAIRGFLNAFGEAPSVELAQRLLEPLLSDEDKFASKEEFRKAFTSVRRNWVARRSPIIGVVVAIKVGVAEPDAKIGWSLCHSNDSFNRHIGIRKAIDSAEPVRVVQQQLQEDARRRKDARLVGKKYDGEIPHTMTASMNEMMSRAARIYNGKKSS